MVPYNSDHRSSVAALPTVDAKLYQTVRDLSIEKLNLVSTAKREQPLGRSVLIANLLRQPVILLNDTVSPPWDFLDAAFTSDEMLRTNDPSPLSLSSPSPSSTSTSTSSSSMTWMMDDDEPVIPEDDDTLEASLEGRLAEEAWFDACIADLDEDEEGTDVSMMDDWSTFHISATDPDHTTITTVTTTAATATTTTTTTTTTTVSNETTGHSYPETVSPVPHSPLEINDHSVCFGSSDYYPISPELSLKDSPSLPKHTTASSDTASVVRIVKPHWKTPIGNNNNNNNNNNTFSAKNRPSIDTVSISLLHDI